MFKCHRLVPNFWHSVTSKRVLTEFISRFASTILMGRLPCSLAEKRRNGRLISCQAIVFKKLPNGLLQLARGVYSFPRPGDPPGFTEYAPRVVVEAKRSRRQYLEVVAHDGEILRITFNGDVNLAAPLLRRRTKSKPGDEPMSGMLGVVNLGGTTLLRQFMVLPSAGPGT